MQNAETVINSSMNKLKKILGEILSSSDPTQVQLYFIIIAFVFELIFSILLFLCRRRLGR